MTPKKYSAYEKELKIFADKMVKSYDNTNMLKELDFINEFDCPEKEFFQTAQRVNLPKNFFLEHEGRKYDNSIIAEDFVRSIVNGERNFILKSMLELENIPRQEMKKFDYDEFVRIVSEIENPTDVFIPLNPFFHSLHLWMSNGIPKIKFENRSDPIILLDNKKIRVHWITSDTSINEIIVIDKDKIKITQKILKQSKTPKEIKSIKWFTDCYENKKLMLYLGEKDKDNFDFIFRTVISKPELDEGAGIVINVKNKLEK